MSRKIDRSRGMTRRQFVQHALTTAGAVAAAPAFLRGQNLNSRLNIAMIGVGIALFFTFANPFVGALQAAGG